MSRRQNSGRGVKGPVLGRLNPILTFRPPAKGYYGEMSPLSNDQVFRLRIAQTLTLLLLVVVALAGHRAEVLYPSPSALSGAPTLLR
jgi:hypothetical protein